MLQRLVVVNRFAGAMMMDTSRLDMPPRSNFTLYGCVGWQPWERCKGKSIHPRKISAHPEPPYRSNALASDSCRHRAFSSHGGVLTIVDPCISVPLPKTTLSTLSTTAFVADELWTGKAPSQPTPGHCRQSRDLELSKNVCVHMRPISTSGISVRAHLQASERETRRVTS